MGGNDISGLAAAAEWLAAAAVEGGDRCSSTMMKDRSSEVCKKSGIVYNLYVLGKEELYEVRNGEEAGDLYALGFGKNSEMVIEEKWNGQSWRKRRWETL